MRVREAVVLCSGGINSLTCLLLAQKEGLECHLLTFDYGQPAALQEIEASKRIAALFHAKTHHLSSLALSMPFTDSPAYLQLRNKQFIIEGLRTAVLLGASNLYVGLNEVSEAKGNDKLFSEFQMEVQQHSPLTTVALRTPLLHLSEEEIRDCGRDLGIDHSLLELV